MNEFLKNIQTRRSIYGISNEATLTDEKLKELVETSVNHVPSAFNSQTSRALLLIGQGHKKLWSITMNQLKARIPEDKFQSTKDKIDSFASGYGTVLFFEEQDTIKNLQSQFPTYSENFPNWSQQASGMLQLVVWTALEAEGMGASLQHYNPLIDEEVAKAFQTPESWKLIGQMPFGKPTADAGEKTFLPIESRVRVIR